MEIGAVKQAFNNEVIQLKKNVNQAKIQVIHKLTRKAKTLAEKKAPDHLKEKLKKKAESAVQEVLLTKKLKPRDIARFIITHTGELNSHLNKPTVDNDKACARLLLHKSLQQKYKSIKEKFGNIPIHDLLMSRQERIKLKKEAKEQENNKKKRKQAVKQKQVVNSEGDWNIKDVEMGDEKNVSQGDESDASDQGDVSNEGSKEIDGDVDMPMRNHQVVGDSAEDESGAENDGSEEIHGDEGIPMRYRQVVGDSSEDESGAENDGSEEIDSDEGLTRHRQVVCDSDESSAENEEELVASDSDEENDIDNETVELDDNDHIQDSDENNEVIESEKFIKPPAKESKPTIKTPKFLVPKHSELKITPKIEPKPPKQKKNPDKKVNDNKNKNLKEKLLNRKFKKDTDDTQTEKKVADPFFITATGENYMSLAEPREPDEVKDIHSQGNRKLRRAVMFGHVPNIKPRRGDFNQNNYRSRKFDNGNESVDSNGRLNKFVGYDKRNKFNDGSSHFNDRNFSNERNSKFSERNSNFNNKDSKTSYDKLNDRNSKFNRNSQFDNNNKVTEVKEVKLHPSWEAKKKQSGILPYKGKKIVFDES